MIGAIGGVYLGVAHTAGREDAAVTSAAGVTQPPTLDAARDRAVTLAEQKAAQAAAEAAVRAKRANELAERAADEASRSTTRTDYPVPKSCDEYDDGDAQDPNRVLGCALLLDAGHGLAEMPCLDRLWTRESGWNPKAENKSSGAYGIPQALPGSKMAAYGDDWRTNPVPQIKWGLNYIKNRYTTPCGAWSHFQSTGWY